MRSLAQFLLLLGAGSFVLHFANMEFRLLMWVDMWGETTGNLIRIGMIALGGILYMLAVRGVSNEIAQENFDDIKPKGA